MHSEISGHSKSDSSPFLGLNSVCARYLPLEELAPKSIRDERKYPKCYLGAHKAGKNRVCDGPMNDKGISERGVQVACLIPHQQHSATSPSPQGITGIGCLESSIRDGIFDHLRLAFMIIHVYSLSFRADTKHTAKLGLKRRQQ